MEKLNFGLSYGIIMTIFNFCMIFFKGEVYFNWWIVILVIVIEYIILLLMLGILRRTYDSMRRGNEEK